jgi:hypothetical protein
MPAAAETILKMFLAVSSTGRFALRSASILMNDAVLGCGSLEK